MQMTHCGIVVLCGLFSNLFTNFVPSVILKRRQDVAISRLVVLQAFGGGNRMKGELPMAHTEEDRRTYDAFISYKHVPYVSKVAHAVLRRLEHYRPPKGSGAQKKRLYLCIDDQNLETAGDLNKQLHEALDHSEYLIYLACPETFNSIYCRDEIRYFKKLHDGRLDNIIVLLLQRKPEDVLPQELCYEGCLESGEMPDPDRQAEVHWLDLRAGSTVKAIKKLNESLLMIAAPLLHCKPDELIQRERQWKKQKCMMWGMLCVVVLAASLSVAYTLWLTWTMDYRRDAEVAMADDDYRGREGFCHSEAALIDTDTYSLFGVMKSQECLISDVIFQDDSQKLALIYNNESGVLENCGYAAVYDCSGNLVFQTNCSGDMIPQRGCFCGDVFLLYCFPTTYFLDAGTGKPIGEPLLAGMDHAFLTDDGQIALECSGNVRYCRLVQYSGGIVEKNRVKDIQVALLNEREMRYRIADHLWLYSSYGGGEIYLQNNKGITLDRFPIRNKEKGNMVLKLSYGESAQTAFVLDDERNLYCIPIDMELEKFVPSEKISVYAGILDFSPAKDGVCYLDNYYPGYYFSEISDLNYITNDTSLFYHDPAVHYMEWVADPHINNSFIGMMSGESDYDYAVIVTRTEGQFNLGFFSMKTGTFLTDMSLEAADDLFVSFGENNDFIIHSGGSWRSMWLGNDRPDGNAIKQLMDISGYKLSGSRFKNDQKLVYARTVMAPNSVLSWSQYLEWEFVPFQEAGRGIE